MDRTRAISVLRRVLSHLPPGIWWPLHPQSPDDLCLAHAFRVQSADIESLLILSGVAKQTAKGFGIVKSGLEDLINSSDGSLVSGNICTVRYVAKMSAPPVYKTPAK